MVNMLVVLVDGWTQRSQRFFPNLMILQFYNQGTEITSPLSSQSRRSLASIVTNTSYVNSFPHQMLGFVFQKLWYLSAVEAITFTKNTTHPHLQ